MFDEAGFFGFGDDSSGGGGVSGESSAGGESFWGFYDVAGSLLQADIARKGAERQNRENRDLANTRWQRGVKDMMAAGINPMLGAMKGDPGSGNPNMVSELGAGVSSGQSGALIKANLEKIRAETDKEKSVAAVNQVMIPKVMQETQTSGASADNLRGQTERISWEKAHLSAQREELLGRRLKHLSEAEKAAAERELIDIDQQLRRLDVIHSGLTIPKARNLSEAEESWFKKNVSPYLGDVGSIFSSASSAATGMAAGRFATMGASPNRGHRR